MLLDLSMPEMSGYQVLKFIREENKDIPIIVVSGNFQEALQSEMDTNLNTHFVVKPCSIAYLAGKIGRVLRH
ncbi:MAG: CheY-like chemotaxis protein [Flavobacterium sp.]|jgi:CheY-like chemotaxis protein